MPELRSGIMVTSEDLLAELEGLECRVVAIEAGVRRLRQNGGSSVASGVRFVDQCGTKYEISPLDPDGPRSREAVRRVMAGDPERVWKVVELKREVLSRG